MHRVSKQGNSLLIASVLFAAVFLVYWPCIYNDFTNLDELPLVLENPAVKNFSFSKILDILQPSAWNRISLYPMPLTMLSYGVERGLFGFNPKIFHLSQLILHAASTILVFLILEYISQKRQFAFLIAILFAIHPIQTKIVACIGLRRQLLYCFFFLCSIYWYIRYLKYEKIGSYLLSLLFCALSLFSMPSGVFLVALLFIVDKLTDRSINSKIILIKIPFLIISGLWAWYSWIVYKAIESTNFKSGYFLVASDLDNIKSLTFIDHTCHVIYSQFFYLSHFFIPYKLSALYPVAEMNINFYLFYPIYFCILLMFLFWVAWKYQKVMWILLAYLFFILPPCLLKQNHVLLAEYFFYLPMIPFASLLLLGFNYLYKRNKTYTLVIQILIGLFIVSMSLISYHQTYMWKNDKVLWRTAIRNYPNNPIPLAHLADYYLSVKNFKLSYAFYNKAIREGYNNINVQLGKITSLIQAGHKKMGWFLLQKIATGENAHHPGILWIKASYMINEAGKIREAISLLDECIQKEPYRSVFFVARACCNIRLERWQLAEEDLCCAVQLDPSNGQVYYLKGYVYEIIGKRKEAIHIYQDCLVRSTDKETDEQVKQRLAVLLR